MKPYRFIFFLLLVAGSGCAKKTKLQAVSTTDFSKFIEETGYVTDAEKYGWSIVQKTVYKYDIVDGATWLNPSGKAKALPGAPVTQVSYNDAMAYCKWAGVRLPTYEEYWQYAKHDDRAVVIEAKALVPAKDANVVGNTWDITATWNDKQEIRLAGGSYLCSKNTCDGTNPERSLFVSPNTGNSNISFSVVDGQ